MLQSSRCRNSAQVYLVRPDLAFTVILHADNNNRAVFFKGMEIYQEVEIRLREPIEWNPQDAFIEKVATKVYYVVPAFVAGVLCGVILWGLYILLYKAGHIVKRRTRNILMAADQPVHVPRLASVTSTTSTSPSTVSTKTSSPVNSESGRGRSC